jgi:hypothetical protein
MKAFSACVQQAGFEICDLNITLINVLLQELFVSII